MAWLNLDSDQSIVALIDVQEALLPHIPNHERLVSRMEFLLGTARLLEIPVIATEQIPEKLGGTTERLRPLATPPIAKSTFSAARSEAFLEALEATNRTQVVLLGVETHICITLTALDLLNRGFDVAVCADGVGARTEDRHLIGLDRMRDEGVVPSHSETIAYEWLGDANHTAFRSVLQLVKQAVP